MKVQLYIRSKTDYTSFAGPYNAALLDCNIKKLEDEIVNFPDSKYVNFISDYSPVYSDSSESKVNTRLRVLNNGNELNPKVHYYCKLNWIERQKLKYIERRLTMQTNPFYFWTSVAAFVISIVSLVISIGND